MSRVTSSSKPQLVRPRRGLSDAKVAQQQADRPSGAKQDAAASTAGTGKPKAANRANNAAIAQHIVNAKTELEKMREQVQNVE